MPQDITIARCCGKHFSIVYRMLNNSITGCRQTFALYCTVYDIPITHIAHIIEYTGYTTGYACACILCTYFNDFSNYCIDRTDIFEIVTILVPISAATIYLSHKNLWCGICFKITCNLHKEPWLRSLINGIVPIGFWTRSNCKTF